MLSSTLFWRSQFADESWIARDGKSTYELRRRADKSNPVSLKKIPLNLKKIAFVYSCSVLVGEGCVVR